MSNHIPAICGQFTAWLAAFLIQRRGDRLVALTAQSGANNYSIPPETLGRLQQSLTNYPNRPTAQQGGGLLQRSG